MNKTYYYIEYLKYGAIKVTSCGWTDGPSEGYL